jgi:hypothetical protein
MSIGQYGEVYLMGFRIQRNSSSMVDLPVLSWDWMHLNFCVGCCCLFVSYFLLYRLYLDVML